MTGSKMQQVVRYLKTSQELFQVGIGQVLATLGGLVGVRLLTSVLTPASYGELALGLTFLTLVQQLIMGPVINAFARYFTIAQEKGGISGYVKAVQILLTKATGLTFVFFVATLFVLLVTGKWIWVGLLALSFLFAVVSSYNAALDNIQNAARQRVVVAWHQGLSQWLRFLLAAGIILLFGATSSNAMLGYFLSAVVVFASQWYFFRKLPSYREGLDGSESGGNESSKWERQMVDFALPFSMWGIITWLQMSSDRWSLLAFASSSTVGLYSVLYQLGYYPITIMTGVFVQFVSPILYRRAGDALEAERVQSAQRLTDQLTLLILGFSLLVTITIWLLRRIIFLVLVAPDYWQVSNLLPWLTLSGGLFAAGQVQSLTASNNNQPMKLLIPKITTGVIGVVLNFLGAYLYGLEGVVGASVLFSLAYFLWIYFLFRSKNPRMD
jgi:O-antigen/teichoic acid export membrane protein